MTPKAKGRILQQVEEMLSANPEGLITWATNYAIKARERNAALRRSEAAMRRATSLLLNLIAGCDGPTRTIARHVLAALNGARVDVPATPALDKLWQVSHRAFQTDDLRWITTLVRAPTREAAQAKFNALAEQRREYPYCWTPVALENVHEAAVIE